MGRCSTCNGPNCGNCLECHNPDCKDGVTVATDPRGQCRYKGKPIPIRKSAFDKAWGVVKDDDDPECEDCGSKIPSGEQYGCERCGKDICGLCMEDDQYGYPGYRGDMDDDIHPAYDEVMSQSGAHCPECASAIVQEYEDEEKERMEEAIFSNREYPHHGKGSFDPKRNFHPDWQDLNRSKDSFESAWGVVKEFIGPREKIEEGKRMVEGNKVLYGQRKWDNVVVPDMLGYIDEEGNERDFSLHTNQGGYKLLGTYPDANIRYRSDQKFPPGERPPPYTWGRKNGMPYPASVRDRYAKRKMREHQDKIRREMIEARDRALRRKRENSD